MQSSFILSDSLTTVNRDYQQPGDSIKESSLSTQNNTLPLSLWTIPPCHCPYGQYHPAMLPVDNTILPCSLWTIPSCYAPCGQYHPAMLPVDSTTLPCSMWTIPPCHAPCGQYHPAMLPVVGRRALACLSTGLANQRPVAEVILSSHHLGPLRQPMRTMEIPVVKSLC